VREWEASLAELDGSYRQMLELSCEETLFTPAAVNRSYRQMLELSEESDEQSAGGKRSAPRRRPASAALGGVMSETCP